MQFVGAAQQPFDSFMELTRFMLAIYWPDWNNTLNPTSYILPQTYSFKNPDKSDDDIQEIKKELEKLMQNGAANNSFTSFQRPVIDRCSDSGEFMVFNAVWALVQDKVQTPFLAISGLDLEKIKCHLNQIFPDVQVDIQEEFKTMMREYDFIIIGPKIGIIVIEVKSSAFTAKNDFREEEEKKSATKKNQRNLPDDIIKGIKQLQSFDLEFFHVCSKIQAPPGVKVRRILFTPNLEKSRLEAWKSHLDKQVMEKVNTWLIDSGIIHWLKEDLSNLSDHSEKPVLYSRLKEMIETPRFQIPAEIYDSYGLIISGFGSALVLKNQSIVKVCDERISTSKAILRDSEALETHDPLHQLDTSGPKRKKQKHDINPENVIQIESKLIMLTREQRAALNGPNRQFIIGHPGTGKTIILQAKALQLLQDGKRILVYTTRGYKGKYQLLFENHGFSRYEIREVSIDGESMSLTAKFIMGMGTESIWEHLESFSKQAMNNEEMRDCLNDFDAVFIDDALDVTGRHWDFPIRQKRVFSLMMLMAIATTREMSSKVVWIAADPYSYDPRRSRVQEDFRRILDQMIGGEQQHYFTCTVLNRVMRSSESVYLATYSKQLLESLTIKPALGHKIHGFSDSSYLRNLSELQQDARLKIWKQAEDAVKRFRREGFDYGHMAVIVGGDIDSFMPKEVIDDFLLYEFGQSGISVTDAANPSPSSLTVDKWDVVSSHEWPIVIYIAIFNSAESYQDEEEDRDESYHRYRACSRATMKIFQIIWNEEDTKVQAGITIPVHTIPLL